MWQRSLGVGSSVKPGRLQKRWSAASAEEETEQLTAQSRDRGDAAGRRDGTRDAGRNWECGNLGEEHVGNQPSWALLQAAEPGTRQALPFKKAYVFFPKYLLVKWIQLTQLPVSTEQYSSDLPVGSMAARNMEVVFYNLGCLILTALDVLYTDLCFKETGDMKVSAHLWKRK